MINKGVSARGSPHSRTVHMPSPCLQKQLGEQYCDPARSVKRENSNILDMNLKQQTKPQFIFLNNTIDISHLT